jgi:hypothetical protein
MSYLPILPIYQEGEKKGCFFGKKGKIFENRGFAELENPSLLMWESGFPETGRSISIVKSLMEN